MLLIAARPGERPPTARAGWAGAAFRRGLRLLAAALCLGATVWAQGAAVAGAPAAASSAPITLKIDGQDIVFAGAAQQGAIYLSKNGYDYLNPGFDFEAGKETSGLSATPDLQLTTGTASPYAVAGDLAVVAPAATAASPAAGRSAVPRAGEVLVVLDGKGRYVLVRIETVTANALTFAYSFGAAPSVAASLGNTVWVGRHRLTFPGTPRRGQITLAGDGEVSVSPGFDFERGRQVSAIAQAAGLTAGIDAAGRLAISGALARVSPNGHTGAWPTAGAVTPLAGELYLVADAAANYVLLQVRTVSATAVSFDYRLLPGRDVPVLPKGPTTLKIAGARVTFAGPPRYGVILASKGGGAFVKPGFDLARGREVAGLDASPDLALQTNGRGALLAGIVATFGALAQAQPPALEAVVASPFGRFVAVDGAGRYVLVGVVAATAGGVSFAYEVQSAGPTAVLQPPNPKSVRPARRTKGAGTLLFATSTEMASAFDFARVKTALPPSFMNLIQTYAYGIDAGRVWRLAGTSGGDAPSLSPDGRWLATETGGDVSVHAARGPTRVVATNGYVLDGALPVVRWSPDGRYLAYIGMVSEGGYDVGHALWLVQPSTGKSRLVVDPVRTGLAVTYVGWLPDDGLVFSNGHAFYEVSAGWDHIVRLPVRAGAMGQDGRFDVSHDGRLLTWVARDAKGHYQVVVATLDGKQRVQFTSARWDSWSPQFAPADNLVVYVADTGPPPGGELFGFTLDGKQSGYIDGPGKRPIAHVVDLEQWYAGPGAPQWRG